jgi:hypothetical protein
MGYEKVDSIQVHFFTLLHNLCADSCISQKKIVTLRAECSKFAIRAYIYYGVYRINAIHTIDNLKNKK